MRALGVVQVFQCSGDRRVPQFDADSKRHGVENAFLRKQTEPLQPTGKISSSINFLFSLRSVAVRTKGQSDERSTRPPAQFSAETHVTPSRGLKYVQGDTSAIGVHHSDWFQKARCQPPSSLTMFWFFAKKKAFSTAKNAGERQIVGAK